MGRISFLFLLLLFAIGSPHFSSPSLASPALGPREQEALHGLEQILDLWRDGRYDELYRRTSGARDGMEAFAGKLAAAPRRPACCWEKLQEAQVSLKGERKALVRARFGFEGSLPGTRSVTTSVHLSKEDGVWTIAHAELLSLAKYSKRRATYKYLPIQPAR